MPQSDDFLEQSLNGGGDPILTIIELTLDGSIYHHANNTEDVVSNVSGSSQIYAKGAFEITLPDDTEEGTPKATLKFATEVDAIRALRSATAPLEMRLWLVLASDPNTVEYGPATYRSSSISISDKSVQIDLEVEPILQLEVPVERFTPNSFPGLFDVIE